MKLLLSSLFLAALCARPSQSVSSADTPAVTQSPDVSVMEGDTVTITCCWKLQFERMRLQWLKNQTVIKTLTVDTNNPSTRIWSNLILNNVTREDSGRYICMVTMEIPELAQVEGNGTTITVTARNNTMDTADGSAGSPRENREVYIYVLRCLPIIALLITFFIIKYIAAQQHAPVAPGSKLTAAQRMEENQDEQEGDDRGIEVE